MKKTARSTVSSLFSIAAASSLALLIFLVSGCGAEENTADTSTETLVAETTSQKPLNQSFLYDMATRRIGDANLVKSATVTGEGNDKVVTFEVIRPAVCHDGAVVGTVATFSQKTMSALFKYPEVSRVDVTLYGTTQDSSTNNEVAVKVTVDRDSANKIDWFALSDLNLAEMVSSFYIDPRIQANWQVEGGGSTPRTATTATVPVT